MNNKEIIQKGNPHSLAVNQHIFPKRSIQRFCNSRGSVDIFIKPIKKRLKLKPNNTLFCANRTWDHRSEIGYMKDIEDEFQTLATAILSGQVTSITKNDARNIIAFLALWRERHVHNIDPVGDLTLHDISPGTALTKDQEEVLEKKGYIVARSCDLNVSIPSRFMTGQNILRSIDRTVFDMSEVAWGILQTARGHFIVPDTFADYALVPLSPEVILLAYSENQLLSDVEVAHINRIAISNSHRYYFAKNLSLCPV